MRVAQLGPLCHAEVDVTYENIGGRLPERVDTVLRCCSLYWVEGAGVIRLHERPHAAPRGLEKTARPSVMYTRMSLFLQSRRLSSSSHFAASRTLPSTIVQSWWNSGEASCGPSKTKSGTRCGFDFMTSAASAPYNMAMLLHFSCLVVVAAPRGTISALLRWSLRRAVSSREHAAVAPRLLEPRARSASGCACRSRSGSLAPRQRSISARICHGTDIVGRRRSALALGPRLQDRRRQPSWALDGAAWELCLGPVAGPLDGVLLAGAALLVNCWRGEPLLAVVAAHSFGHLAQRSCSGCCSPWRH